MTYYQANTDSEMLICDNCGATRWAEHAKYGTNTETRAEEEKVTGVRWSWVPRYSSNSLTCFICGGVAK